MFQTKVVEKIKTRILLSITFFFENCAFNKIKWKNIARPGRPQMTIWRMRIACWVPKSTYTHSIYVIIIIAFPLQQWSLRFTYIACLVLVLNGVFYLNG